MGMFSWCCKGCGYELKSGEYVRLNGCKGEYDGYGGNDGGFDYHRANKEPIAWHEACYQKATPVQKIDETPSKWAKNQGFGYKALAFLERYDPKTETFYTVVVDQYDPSTGRANYLYLTCHGDFALESLTKYEELIESAYSVEDAEKWYLSLPDDISEAELEKLSRKQQEEIEYRIGMRNPERNAHQFDSWQNALKAVMPLLPNGDIGVCILGHQGKISGLVYSLSRFDGTETVEYEDNTTT